MAQLLFLMVVAKDQPTRSRQMSKRSFLWSFETRHGTEPKLSRKNSDRACILAPKSFVRRNVPDPTEACRIDGVCRIWVGCQRRPAIMASGSNASLFHRLVTRLRVARCGRDRVLALVVVCAVCLALVLVADTATDGAKGAFDVACAKAVDRLMKGKLDVITQSNYRLVGAPPQASDNRKRSIGRIRL